MIWHTTFRLPFMLTQQPPSPTVPPPSPAPLSRLDYLPDDIIQKIIQIMMRIVAYTPRLKNTGFFKLRYRRWAGPRRRYLDGTLD